MARTRTPRPPPPHAGPQPESEFDLETRLAVARAEPPLPEALIPPPIVTPRRSQRFGIFLTAANGGAGVGRRRSLTVPRSTP